MHFRHHSLVQDSDNMDPTPTAPEENDVTALFSAPEIATYGIAASSRREVLSQLVAALFDGVEVTNRRFLSPLPQRVASDSLKICFREMRKAKNAQGLVLLRVEFQGLANTIECVALRESTLSPSSIAERRAASFASN